MDANGRRKYRSREFGVNVGTSVSPETFNEIEELSKMLSTTKADVVRRLIIRGLSDLRSDGKLTSASTAED